MSRLAAFLLAALSLLVIVAAPASAHADTDSVVAALARYPELPVRVTETGIEAPAEVAAGRYRLVQENATAEPAHFFVARLPEDVTDAAFEAALASPEEPEWFGRLTMTGNPDRAAPNGGRAEGIVDLPAGHYFLMDPTSDPLKVRRFDVTAASVATPAASSSEPEPAVAVEMREMAFDMPGVVPAGRHLWRVANIGALPHEIAILPVPGGATADQAVTAMGAVFEGGSAGDAVGPAWAGWSFVPVGGVGVTSPGGAAWAAIDLAPGSYVAFCFYPDAATGMPHLMQGMTTIFAAEDRDPNGTPTA